MKIRFFIFLLAMLVLGGGAFLCWRLFFSQSDEELIREDLSELQELLSKTEGQKPLSGLEEMGKVKRHLTAEIVLRAPEFGYEGKMDRAVPLRAFSVWRKNCSALQIEFSDVQIRFPRIKNEAAEADFTASVKNTSGGSSAPYFFQVRTVWKKVKREWKIAEVELGAFSGEISGRPAHPLVPGDDSPEADAEHVSSGEDSGEEVF